MLPQIYARGFCWHLFPFALPLLSEEKGEKKCVLFSSLESKCHWKCKTPLSLQSARAGLCSAGTSLILSVGLHYATVIFPRLKSIDIPNCAYLLWVFSLLPRWYLIHTSLECRREEMQSLADENEGWRKKLTDFSVLKWPFFFFLTSFCLF